MPRPTEFLERMTVVRCGDDTLEALYHRGRGALPVVLAPGHPRLYGTMESAPLAELAWALSQRGHPTLRFNFRGVGASTGTSSVAARLERVPDEGPLSPAELDESYADLCAAIEQHLETCDTGSLGIVGYSFGAAVAARAAIEHPKVERVALVVPPVQHLPFDFDALASSGTAVYLVVGELDRVAPPEVVEAAAKKRFFLQRIAGANHEMSRGLSTLGQIVASVFPGEELRPSYDG